MSIITNNTTNNITKQGKKTVGIIGATGYAGVELLRLLLNNSFVEVTHLSSISFEGKTIDEVYPCFANICTLKLVPEDVLIQNCDIIFCALPHGLSEKIAQKAVKINNNNKLIIDLGADFRLHNKSDYKYWYNKDFDVPELHKNAIYSIPELSQVLGHNIQDFSIIANPGCFPTSAALGLAPLLHNNLICPNSIIIDSKSGVTGAGRSPSPTTHFAQLNESFAPYKIAEHRHTPEIEQTLSIIAKQEIKITFVPHLLPVNRGILSSIYSSINSNINKNIKINLEYITNLYLDFYKNKKFIRILNKNINNKNNNYANIKSVANTNYCDISIHLDSRTNRIIIVSAIDNMIKGAAGQAIQNMNLALGFPEDNALNLVSSAF